MAQKTLHTDDPASWNLIVLVFSDTAASTVLFEKSEEDTTLIEVRLTGTPESSTIAVSRPKDAASKKQYQVREWKRR